jgi:GNAT superfamily N-acetyltransferase
MELSAITLSSEGYAELDAFLVDRIYEFNAKATAFHDGEVFAAAIRGSAGDVLAGVTGHTWGGTCYVTHLWVQERHRREGLGSSLMAAVESEAKTRGCSQVILATHSFQAPAFYERLGYKLQAAIPEYPRGYAQLHYFKCLTGTTGA